MSDSVRPHRRQPTRLPRTWYSPGKNTGVGCHFLLQCMKVKSESELLSPVQPSVTPWTATYQAPLSMGFSRQELLEWVAIAFSVIATRKCLITMCHKESNKGSQLCNETGVCLSSFMKFTVKWPDLGLTTATLFFPFLPFNQ